MHNTNQSLKTSALNASAFCQIYRVFMQKIADVRLAFYFQTKTSIFEFKNKSFFFCIDKYFVWNRYWNINLYIVVKPCMLFGLT